MRKSTCLAWICALYMHTTVAADGLVVETDGHTVRDAATTLTWQRSRSATGVTWKGAYDYCDELGIAGGGWRLPSVYELKTLISSPSGNSHLHIDTNAFPDTPAGFFWTSSATPEVVAGVFFDMSDFPKGTGPDESLGFVRCTRGKLADDKEDDDLPRFNLITIPRSLAR